MKWGGVTERASLLETDTKAVRCLVQHVMAAIGARELRTDEFCVWKHTIAEEDHTVYLAHRLKSKRKRASDLAWQFQGEG